MKNNPVQKKKKKEERKIVENVQNFFLVNCSTQFLFSFFAIVDKTTKLSTRNQQIKVK